MISTYHRVYLSIHMLFTWFAFNFRSASKALAVHENGCVCVCVCWCPSHFGASSSNRFFLPCSHAQPMRCDAMWCDENVRSRFCLHIKKHICASESFASFLQNFLNFFPLPRHTIEWQMSLLALLTFFHPFFVLRFAFDLIPKWNDGCKVNKLPISKRNAMLILCQLI